MIDWDRVTTLRDEVGAEDFDEVVELFIAEVDETIQRMKTAPDPSRLEEDLHFLKGSALNLGFDELSRLCENGEQLSAKGQVDSVDIPQLFSCYKDSKKTFLDDLHNACG